MHGTNKSDPRHKIKDSIGNAGLSVCVYVWGVVVRDKGAVVILSEYFIRQVRSPVKMLEKIWQTFKRRSSSRMVEGGGGTILLDTFRAKFSSHSATTLPPEN